MNFRNCLVGKWQNKYIEYHHKKCNNQTTKIVTDYHGCSSVSCPDLFSIPLGLDIRVQTPDQRHTIPRLTLQQPVAMQPLHELIFPLAEDSFADDIQPVQQRWMQVGQHD